MHRGWVLPRGGLRFLKLTLRSPQRPKRDVGVSQGLFFRGVIFCFCIIRRKCFIIIINS